VPRKILDRFDIVGADPRGVGGSTPIRCFTSQAQRARVEGPLTAAPFPVTAAAQRTWIGAARALGRACSTTARPIASAMSTTEDARDMDVLRRALGDRKLTFLGVSYGSYLGLVYASMFLTGSGRWCSTASSTAGLGSTPATAASRSSTGWAPRRPATAC
jgi:pimeloyl-ACP methyl ester carboxylesterase